MFDTPEDEGVFGVSESGGPMFRGVIPKPLPVKQPKIGQPNIPERSDVGLIEDDPLDDATDADMVKSFYYATLTGKSPALFYDSVKEADEAVERLSNNEPGFWQGLKATYRHAYMGLQRMKLSAKQLYGWNTPQDDNDLITLDNEIAKLAPQVEAFKPSGFIGDTLKAHAEVLPSIFDEYAAIAPAPTLSKEESPMDTTLSMVGSHAAPGVVYRFMKNLFLLGAGGTHEELKNITDEDGNTINPALMKALCAVSGVFQGAVEFGQSIIDGIFVSTGAAPGAAAVRGLTAGIKKKFLSHFSSAALKAAQKKIAVRAVARGAITLAEQDISESIEEGIQKSIEIGAVELAKSWENATRDTGFKHTTLVEAGKEILDETLHAMQGMILIGVPGGTVAGVRSAQHDVAMARAKENAERIIEDARQRLVSKDPDKIVTLAQLDDSDGAESVALGLLRDNLYDDRGEILKAAGSIDNVSNYLIQNGWHGTEIPSRVALSVKSYLESEKNMPFVSGSVKNDADRAMRYKGLSDGTEWYRDNGLTMFTEGETDLDTLKFFATLAYTSIMADPNTNLAKAIGVWQRYKAGLAPIRAVGSLVVGEDKAAALATVLESDDPMAAFNVVSSALGPEIGAVKVRNFAQTLMLANTRPEALYAFAEGVVDFRMGQYFYNDPRVPSGYARLRINDRLKQVRDYLRDTDDPHFWTVDRVQSALWHHVKNERQRLGLDPVASAAKTITYSKAIDRQVASHFNVDIESVTQQLRDAFRVTHLIANKDAAAIFDYYAKEAGQSGQVVTLNPAKGGDQARIRVFSANTEAERQLWNQPRMRVLIQNRRLVYDRDADPAGLYKAKKPNHEKIEAKLIKSGYIGVSSGNVTVMFSPVRGFAMNGFTFNISPSVDPSKIEELRKRLETKTVTKAERAELRNSLKRLEKLKELVDQGTPDAAAELAAKDAWKLLQHPMFDILRLSRAAGQFEMYSEESLEGVAEVANREIFLGRVAEYLKLYRQDCGYVSELAPSGVRPSYIPGDQAPSVVFVFPHPLKLEQRLKLQEIVMQSGFSGSTYSIDKNTLTIDHVPLVKVERDGKIEREYDMDKATFKAATKKLAARFAAQGNLFMQKVDLPVPTVFTQWKKHTVIGAENYDNIIKSGRDEDRKLASDLALESIRGRRNPLPRAIREREKLYLPEEFTRDRYEKYRTLKHDEIQALVDISDLEDGMRVEETESIIARMRVALPNLPPIITVDSMQDLPPSLVGYLLKRGRVDGRAWFVGSKNGSSQIIIVSSRMRDAGDVVGAVLHEAAGHYGLRALFGGNYPAMNKFLDDVYSAKQEECDRVARKYHYDVSVEGDRRATADEWFAAQQENPKTRNDPWYVEMVEKLIQLIRNFARSIGVELRLSDYEIRSTLILAADALKNKPDRRQAGSFFDTWGRGKHGLYEPSATISAVRAMYAGQRARMLPLTGQFGEALSMFDMGKNREEIWRETGWWIGPDSLWRFEVDDSKAAYTEKLTDLLKNGGFYTLGEVLDHPELYKYYPQLKSIFVERSSKWGESGYNENKNTITLDSKFHLFHEIQHAVQHIEGFTRGGSPAAMATSNIVVKMLEEDPILKDIHRRLEANIEKERKMTKEAGTPTGQPINVNIIKETGKLRARYRRLWLARRNDFATEAYYLLYGELESYDTEQRRALSAEMRRKVIPLTYGTILAEGRITELSTGQGMAHITPDKWIVGFPGESYTMGGDALIIERGEGTSFSVARRSALDPPLDSQGNELVDMDNTPMPLNPDGTVTLYHRTNFAAAKAIMETGKFLSKENTNEVYFSNKREGQAEGYGDEVIAVRVFPHQVRMNDHFHGGEIHVAIPANKLSMRDIRRAKAGRHSDAVALSLGTPWGGVPDVRASIADIKPTKTRIRALSGQVKVGELQIDESVALEAAFKKAEQAARKAYTEGKRAGVDLMKVEKKALLETLRDTANARILMKHKEAIEHYKELAQKRKERAAEREYVRGVIENIKQVQRALPKLPPQERDAIQDLVGSFDLTKLSHAKTLRLQRTREFLANNPEAELPGYVMDDLSRLDKIPIRDLTIDNLKSVDMMVRHFMHLARLKNRIKVARKERWLQEVKAESIGQMRDPKDISDRVLSNTKGFWDSARAAKNAVKDFLWFNQMRYDTVVDMIAGRNSVLHDVLLRQISEGQDTKLKYVQDAFTGFVRNLGDFRDRFGVKNIGQWLNEPVFTLETATAGATPQATTVQLTRGQVMALYRHSLVEDNMSAILKGGFGFRQSDDPNRRFVITPDQVNAAIATMGEAEHAFAGFPVEALFKQQGKLIGQVFYQKNGYELPLVEHYYPKHVMPLEFGAVGAEEQDTLEKLKGRFTRVGIPKGFTKERVGSIKGVYLNSIEHDIARSVHDASGYIGLELPMTNASRLFFDKEFRRELESRYGQDVWGYIDQGLRDIAGEHKAFGVMDDAFHALRANISTSVLGLRPWTMLKQLAGLGLYTAYLKPTYLARAIFTTMRHPNETTARHKAYSPKFLERVESGFSRDIQEVYKLLDASSKMFGERELSFKEIRTFVMKPLQFFDKASIVPGMEAAVNQALDEMESGKISGLVQTAIQATPAEVAAMGPEERLRLAYKFADMVTAFTQPMYNPEHRSAISRGNVFYKMLSMFTESANAMFNMIVRSYEHGKATGEWSSFTRSMFAVLVLNAGWIMLVNWFKHRFYDDPEDEKKGWDFKKIVNQWLSEVTGLMYGVGQIYQSSVYKQDPEFPITEVMGTVGKTLGSGVEAIFEQDEEKRKRAARATVRNVISTTQLFLGIPLDEPIRIGQAAYRAVAEEEF